MATYPLFTAKINPQKPFNIYNQKKFNKQPFLIVRTEIETIANGASNFSLDSEQKPEKYYSTSGNSTALPQSVPSYPTQIKSIPEASYLQSLTLQLSLLKQQQNPNKYFVNCNGPNNSSNPEANFAFNQYTNGGSYFLQDKDKLLNNLTLPEAVLRKMSSNNVTRFIEKTNKNYKNISKSPDLRKITRKNTKDGNLSMDDNKSIDGFLSDEESKENNKPIYDVKHLPSPNSRKIINYDDLKIYNEDDECLELEEQPEDEMKSNTSKDFQL